MNEKPLVSLIIPLYNAENYLFRMMDSLAQQDYNHIQLILVNDGSKDRTEEIAVSYKEILSEKGFDFLYLYQENKGVGGAINTGLKYVKGEYLCWADQDDYFEPNAFSVRVDYMCEHPECSTLTCNAYYHEIGNLTEKREVGNSKYADDPNQFYHMLNYESTFCPGCHMIRMTAFKEVNPQMDIYEDLRGQNWQLLLPVYYRFDRTHLPMPIYNYIIHNGSVSHFDKNYDNQIQWYNDNEHLIIETIKRMLIPDEEKNRLAELAAVFHCRLKMGIARSYDRKDDFASFYNKLKSGKKLTARDVIKGNLYKLFGIK